jgi:aminopeptidase
MLPEFQPGARNAVRVCLGIGSSDRVAIIQDQERAPIAEAISEEAASTGAAVRVWTMEDWVSRPAREFSGGLTDELVAFAPTASFFIGGAKEGELAFRIPMRKLLVEQLGCRHGHMIGIDRQLMLDGMAGDYEQIYRQTRQVYEVVRQVYKIEAATSQGTELTATFNSGLRWVPCDGRYHEQRQWGNLPEGEVFTCPASVDGLLAGEELGDYFTERFGLLKNPIRLRIKASRVVAIEGDGQLRGELEAYLGQHPESNRVGEFAVGTNVGLTKIVGNFLQDEKFPGVHVAFGDPYGHETGADWHCPSHVDVLASHAHIWADGRKIMEAGRFLL